MKQFAKKYKGFTVLLIIEAAFLIFMLITCFGKANNIQLSADKLIITDDKTVLEEYEPKDSMMLVLIH